MKKSLFVLIAFAMVGPAHSEPDYNAAIEQANRDPAYRKKLLANPGLTLGTTDQIRVVEEPPNGRVFVLRPFDPNARSAPPTADAATKLDADLLRDKSLRTAVINDWKQVFRTRGIPIPKDGQLRIVEARPNETILILAAPVARPRTGEDTRHAVGVSERPIPTRKPGDVFICKDPPCHVPGDGDPPPPPKEYRTTILKIDHKRWNQNPFGPGCKNDNLVPFEIPAGAELYSITIGETGCGTGGQDVPVGKYIDTHVAFGIVAGGTVLNSRPPNGAKGKQQLSFHWWFNQWGHSQAFICVNVKSKKPLTIDSTRTDRYTHVNMDDGWVKHRVKLPVCFREVSVALDLQGAIDDRNVSYKDVSFGAKVVNSDHCVIEWFGCRNEQNIIP